MLRMIPVPGVFLLGIAVFLVVAWDAFEAIILPRRVTRKFRLTRFYYLLTWSSWKKVARVLPSHKARETFLGFFGPISLLQVLKDKSRDKNVKEECERLLQMWKESSLAF